MGFDIGDKAGDALNKGKDAVNDKTAKDTVKDEHVDKAKDALNDKFGNKD
ncbi:ribosome recycling factor [Rothia koreensis]